MKKIKTFTGEENHSITTAEALTFIKYYKEHFGRDAEPGCFFDKQAAQSLLEQPNAVGLRYYYGVDELGSTRLILAGVASDRSDLMNGEPLKLSIMHPPTDAQGKYVRAAVSHAVSDEQAAELTERYREAMQPEQPKGGFFSKNAIQRLLDAPECHGLRFFFGANRDGKRVIVIMCTDRYGAEQFDGPTAEISYLCPPFCGPGDMLAGGVGYSSKRQFVIK